MAGTTVYKGVSSVNFVKLLRGELNDPPFLQDGIATAGEVYKDRDSSMYYYCHTTTPSAQTTPVSTYFSDTPISIKRSEKRIRELEESKLDASDLVDVPQNDSTKVLSAKGGNYLDDKINTKEPKFSKNSGFNLNKSDSVTSTSTTTLATSKAVKTLNDAKLNKSGGTVSGSLTVTGTVYCNGNITAFSDIRLKENLNIIEHPLDKVLKVNGYTYNMVGHKERMTGVIAQELEQVLPEAVNETDEGIKSVAYGNVIGLLIEAIKEQNKEIEKLKALVM